MLGLNRVASLYFTLVFHTIK